MPTLERQRSMVLVQLIETKVSAKAGRFRFG